MDIAVKLAPYVGCITEARIEDISGCDPIAPPRTFTLQQVKLEPGSMYVQCYLSRTQYVSVPVFDDARTRLLVDEQTGARFISEDREAKLVYTLAFGPAAGIRAGEGK